MGQESSDDYLNKVIQSWAYLEEHMMILKNANTEDFDNVIKCNILKSIMSEKSVSVSANNNLVVGNLAINSSDTLWAWMRAKY
ncbi:18639_t:CDS:1, partial [Racocetra fulgida]